MYKHFFLKVLYNMSRKPHKSETISWSLPSDGMYISTCAQSNTNNVCEPAQVNNLFFPCFLCEKCTKWYNAIYRLKYKICMHYLFTFEKDMDLQKNKKEFIMCDRYKDISGKKIDLIVILHRLTWSNFIGLFTPRL